ncbi:zf-HC2 domain-containing protein [Actinoplanes sp. LDG1-06]|uniref:Zf-HC2 domain-containing protein n=1 Tax=Paractinoplanes ovalisporus TaxID=2810368 RepID=A0ABS2AIH3_9ACTN|nr:zf-HC2 domain-containing protein [Actinoplanes ovalisporus]MBM2619649.1 zf-HC2 domain-containing protein [Actinoplanes ovalisporus]
MTNHIPAASLAAYTTGDPALDDTAVWTIEVHLENCPDCRAQLAAVAPEPLTALLDDVQVMIDRGVRTGPEPVRRRAWRRLAHRWAMWSLIPWLVTIVAAVLAAFALDRSFPERPSLVLLLAPVAPLAGMASAWSRRTDPGWEITAGTSRAGLELLLRRTAVILAVVLPPLALAGWRLGTTPALWLLPALTFTAATLLLGGRIGVVRAAAVLGGSWFLVVVAPALVTADMPALIEPSSTPGWVVAAVVGAALAIWRVDDHRRNA